MKPENLESVYRLSPTQEGILFHTLYEPGSGLYVLQLGFRLRGDLDVPALRRAWETVLGRHAVLRTAFHWEGLEKPVQVVHRRVPLPWREEDWSALSAADRDERWRELCRSDLEHGFDLATAPLLRLTLVREGGGLHRFLWSFHHILVDGWCLPILFQEVFAAYAAHVAGREPALMPRRPYREFIAWLLKQDQAAAEPFWRQALEGFRTPTPLELEPLRGLDPSRPEHAMLEEALPAALTADLTALARRHRLTLNTLVQGAWALLLARDAGEDDVVFGITVSGRSAPVTGIETMVGLFINTLPARIRVPAEAPLLPWLKGIQEGHSRALQYESVPLVQVQGWSEVPRGVAMFESLLVFENYPVDRAALAEAGTALALEIEVERAVNRVNYPLSMAVFTGEQLVLHLKYNTRRVEATAAARRVGQLKNLLEGLMTDPQSPIGGISSWTAGERHQVIVEWNDTRSGASDPRGFHEIFSEQARRTPDAVALAAGGVRLSYRELDERTNRLAHRLLARGAGRGQLVALYLERSAELIEGILAAHKAGAAYLPLDPAFPADRIESILADAGPAVLVTSAPLAAGLGRRREDVLCLEEERDLLRALPAQAPEAAVEPEDLAYVIYTSGSTGRPKGVAVEHRHLTSYIRGILERLRPPAGAEWAVASTLAADLGHTCVFPALATGGCLHVISSEDSADPAAFADYCRRHPIDILKIVPSHLAALEAAQDAAVLPRLRLVLGGEAFDRRLAERLVETVPAGCLVLNHYGPTETTVGVTTCSLAAGLPWRRATVPLGRPLAETRAHVADFAQRGLPIGVPGELLLGGDHVSRGYFARPDLTAERFIPDPFGGSGERLYRTGDRVRLLPDGQLEFLGRIDRQVKIRGFRIEPGEIEAALALHPSIRAAVVEARPDRSGERRLVAWVVPAGPVSAAEVEAFLARRLPEPMVPRRFVLLDALPLTANGKVDRRALEVPVEELESREGAPPRNEIEELLVGLWAEALDRDRVGIHDDFFALGGHSLLAMRLISRIRATFGLELPLRRLFEASAPAAMAERIAEMAAEPLGPALPPITAAGEGDAPLSFAQERLWFLDQLEPGSPTYNLPYHVSFRGPLEPRRLEHALGEVVRRHAVLRTLFPKVSGLPVQRILRPAGLSLPRIDLTGLPADSRRQEAARLSALAARLPFDLAEGPVLRGFLLRLAAEEHSLLLGLHHIVCDAWSREILARELAVVYEAETAGLPSPLGDLPVQYADFARWQRGRLYEERLEAQLGYWRERLQAPLLLLELPVDRPRTPAQSSAGDVRTRSLSPGLSGGMERLLRQSHATPFMLLLASFQALLHRYSGQSCVIVGTPIANRGRAELEPLIGFFVNSLAMRADLTGEMSFSDLLLQVRRSSLDAFSHQDLPFERLVEALQVDRGAARTPLFQTLFLTQTAAPPAPPAGLEITPLEAHSGTAKFDLTLMVSRLDGRFAASAEYSTDLFDGTTIERCLEHFERLLEAAVNDPARRLSDLPWLAAAESHQVLREWATTDEAVPRSLCLHELVAPQVERTPQAVAVVCEGDSLTYAGLDAAAGRLARGLRRRGVGPDVVVGLLADRSLEMIVGILGILKAGGAYLPLDSDYPLERLAYMLSDAGAPLVLVQEPLLERWAGSLPVEALPLGAGGWASWGEDGEQISSACSPENLACVMYTSGSTGRPKGVMVPHQSLCNRLLWAQDVYRLGTEDAFLQKTSFGFDVSIWEIFGALQAGARLVLTRPEGHRDTAYLLRTIVEEKISFVHFVPSMLAAFLEEEGVERCTSLRQVFSGGELLSPELRDRCFSRLGTRLDNEYGPTEASIDVTRWVCAPGQDPRRVPIGRPIARARLHVVDRTLSAVPIGVPGELLAGGPGIVRGYLGRPELTAEKFVPDPWSEIPGERLYRTGDLVRWLRDGALEFLGRLDHQVKLRGLRIELGEIESVLAAQPGVRQATVVVREDQRLVAYVVPTAAGEPVGDLRQALAARLAAYMVPAAFVELEAFPLTANGKLDRRALPEPDGFRLMSAGSRTVLLTPFEELLAGIWRELLGVERVEAEDDFFALGGHSLLAARVVSRVRAVLGVELPLRTLFEAPTLAGLAREIATLGAAGVPPPIVPVPRGEEAPLSFAQQRLWLLDRILPGSAAYNIPIAVRLSGDLKRAALAASLGEVVARHEVLRTVFITTAGEPRQRILAAAGPLALPLIDLSALPAPLAEASRLAISEARRPFDLMRGPLVRGALIRLSGTEHHALLTLHHIISDGWSTGVLIRELATLYPAFTAGETPPLPPLPVQYADFAIWQREWLAGERLAQQLDNWRARLSGAPPVLDLPLSRPRPPVRRLRGAHLPFEIWAEELSGLSSLQREGAATLFMVLLAGFLALLSRLSGQEDLVVGSPVAGRNQLETEGLIGFFVNMLALRGDLSGNPSFMELLARIRKVTLEAYTHADLPFEKLVEELQTERSLAHSPVFQVVLVLQNMASDGLELPGLRLEPVDIPLGSTKFDLTVSFIETPAGLTGSWEYDHDLFDATAVRRFQGHFRELLRGAVAAPGRCLSELPWLSEAESHQLLREWNGSQESFAAGLGLHEMFAAVARRWPGAVAVSWEQGGLSYGELDRQSGRLARRLRESGVGPEVPVALCLERGPELVVAVLAVLKAGGAYVPIDPSYPRERQSWILEDSRALVVVTGREAGSQLPASQARRLVLEEEDLTEGPVLEGAGTGSDSLAYVIYTSGSTGRPKGVLVRHDNVVRLFTATQAWFGFGRQDVWTLFHSYAFDFSVWEMWGALLYGGRLVVVPYWISRSPEAFHELLRQQAVTVLSQTPSAFDQLVRADRDAPLLEALRLVVFGGEALDLSRLRPWWERYGERGPRLVNMYGITETTVHVTYRPVVPADLERPGSPIGVAIRDLELRVLDRWQRPVAMRVAGELCVGGAGLARGYLGRPELTAERFVPDPFGEQPGARLYRSGDLARYRENGDLEHLGRIDHQVKIRGFRIELGEIEAALRAYPGVSEVVVVQQAAGGERRLVAYVGPAREDLTVASLRQFLRESLPEPLVPAFFVLLERLPLTAHGKVDRRALPAPEAPAGGGSIAPRTALERQLAEVWADLLQARRVGLTDNFFDLGGDSIQAVRLVSRVNERLGSVLRVQDVFKHQTVAEMAGLLETGEAGRSHEQEHEAGLAQIERLQQAVLAEERQRAKLPAGYEDFFPLSATEKGMIYYSLLLPDQPVYHEQFIYLVSIGNIETFFRAFELVVGRHPILRSTFHLYGFTEPMKVVRTEVTLSRDVEDLSELPEDRQRQRIMQYQAEDLRNTFDFDGGLLWRLKLFHLAEGLWCLALTAHHAILDGWSNVALWKELNDLCARPDLATITALPPLASTYKDHLAITLGRERSAATETFWREILKGHERNRLPFQRSRTRTGADGMDTLIVRPEGLLEALRTRARELHVPLKALCLAAHVHLLHITSGESDVVTGVVSHDRPGLPDGDLIIGCFLNSIPVRIGMRSGESGGSLVRRVSDYLVACREHEIPLVDIAALVAARGVSQNPIFDTLFNFLDFHLLTDVRENVLFGPMAAPGWQEFLGVRGNEMTNTLLDVEVSMTMGSLTLKIKYSPRHFEPTDIERALGLYARILEGLAREPEAPFGSEALLSEAEREELIHRFNATDYPRSQGRLLHASFEGQAARWPQQPAVVCAGRTLRYGQVEERANRLARHLLTCGVEVGENVGLIAERSPELLVAMLAILKAGAAYVPMEPDYPAARKGHIVRQSGVRRVLSDRICELPAEAEVDWLVPNTAELSSYPGSPLPVRARESDLAYTIYTSGSTGVPKGVMIEHWSAVNLIEWVNREYAVGPGTRVLMVSSVCFDLSVYDVFGALGAGAAVVVARAEEVQDPSALWRLVLEQGVTFWNSVPSTLGLLVQYLEETGEDARCESMEVVFLSGDWIPLSLPERARRFFPRARLVSLGGATEAAVWSIFHPIEKIDPEWTSIPYGRPLANNTFFLLDRSLELVPPGVVGDLYIGGAGVARGYAGDPQKTAVSFVPDPFAASAGARLYRTGDLGRMLSCGEIEFLGRRDHQVKVRGFRIELGEIESQLGRHPAVQEAVVMACTDRSGQKYLCAYVVALEMPSALELKAHLGQSLPEYMVPEVYVRLAELPLTANGKVDRQRLPEPELASLSAESAYVAPSGEVESALVTIWEEVLGVEGIGSRHDFFALGGHSLSAVQVITRIRRQLGVELPLRILFDNPTIAGIGPAISRLRESGAVPQGLAAAGLTGERPRPAHLPLSFSQQRIWFLQQLNPGSTAFNLPLVLRLSGQLDIPAFMASLGEMCRRHETLRTTFPQLGAGPVQRIAPAWPQPLPCVDLAGLAPARRERETRLLVHDELARPFDLARGPLLRTFLLRLSGEEHVGIFHLHHIVADGWSLGLLSEEVATLYTAYTQGLPSPLPELPVQYADYTLWQREWISEAELERQLAYWRAQLGRELPVLRLPMQRPRPARPSYRGQMEPLQLPGDLSDAARRLAREEGVTMFVLLLAAFKALLRLYTGQEDLVVGTVTANRGRLEIERLIGFFVNTLALRTDLSGDPTFRELVARVRDVAFEAYEHQDVPFERVLEELELQRSGNAPVFQVKFQLMNFDGDARELPGLTSTAFESRLETSQSDLTLTITREEGEIRGTLVYSTDLFEASTIHRIARQLESLLAGLVAGPDRRLSSFSLLDDDAAEQLIAAFNEI